MRQPKQLTALIIILCLCNLANGQRLTLNDKIDLILKQTERQRCSILHLDEQYPIKQFNDRLRAKFQAGRSRIGSIEDFIDKAATRSRVTNSLYQYRCKNGMIGELAGWLHQISARLERAEWSVEKLNDS